MDAALADSFSIKQSAARAFVFLQFVEVVQAVQVSGARVGASQMVKHSRGNLRREKDAVREISAKPDMA
jgi:hypothetical protein